MPTQDFFTNGADYAVVSVPEGQMIGPRLGDLISVGPPQGIVTKLSYRYEQSEIAEMLGVTQQTVSRWISQYTNMDLSSEAWAELARRVGEAQSITGLERDPKARPGNGRPKRNQEIE